MLIVNLPAVFNFAIIKIEFQNSLKIEFLLPLSGSRKCLKKALLIKLLLFSVHNFPTNCDTSSTNVSQYKRL